MSELGATHYRFSARVDVLIQQLISKGLRFSANTYRDHPWPDWDRFSVDFWGARGRGWPIGLETGHEIVRHVYEVRHEFRLRHYIYRHTLWTSFGGFSTWPSEDHSGDERHVHVTLWP